MNTNKKTKTSSSGIPSVGRLLRYATGVALGASVVNGESAVCNPENPNGVPVLPYIPLTALTESGCYQRDNKEISRDNNTITYSATVYCTGGGGGMAVREYQTSVNFIEECTKKPEKTNDLGLEIGIPVGLSALTAVAIIGYAKKEEKLCFKKKEANRSSGDIELEGRV